MAKQCPRSGACGACQLNGVKYSTQLARKQAFVEEQIGCFGPVAAIPIFLYQGAIALGASFLAPYLTEAVILEMKCVGSILILGLSLNMLGLTKIKVMNYVPAVFLPILLCRFL